MPRQATSVRRRPSPRCLSPSPRSSRSRGSRRTSSSNREAPAGESSCRFL